MAKSLREMIESGEAQVASAPTQPAQSLRALVESGAATVGEAPEVGEKEHFVNRFTDVVPLGRPAVNLLSTAVMQGAKALGVGRSGVEFTPQGKAAMEAAGYDTGGRDVIPGPVENYRNIRDERERRLEAGADQNPTADKLALGSGLLASVLAPLPRIGAGGPVGSAALTGAAYGGLFGATHGKADWTKGEVRQGARDILGADGLKEAGQEFKDGNYGRAALRVLGSGAAGGLTGGAAVAGAVQPLARLTGRAARGQATAQTDQLARTQAAADRARNQRHGAYRSGVQSASRDIEVLERIAEGSDDLAWEASGTLGTPRAEAVRQMVGRGKLESIGERLDEVDRLRVAAQEATAAAQPEAVQAAAQQALANPIRTQILPRARTYLNRSIPTAVGGAIGGAPGAMVGGLVANTLGRPTTALANAIQSPAVRNMSWGALRHFSELAGQGGQRLGERALEMDLPMSRTAAYAEADADEQQQAIVQALLGRSR